MRDFLDLANLEGKPPKLLRNSQIKIRQKLINKMLENRHLVRFIIAPTMYGKSYLAASYAKTIFEYRHCYWIDCSSPCFIRDLDSDKLEVFSKNLKKSTRLIVFDNLRVFLDERTNKFCNIVRSIEKNNIEIIITCRPYDDNLESHFLDRVVIDSLELLLNNEEIKERMQSNMNFMFQCMRLSSLENVISKFKTNLESKSSEAITELKNLKFAEIAHYDKQNFDNVFLNTSKSNLEISAEEICLKLPENSSQRIPFVAWGKKSELGYFLENIIKSCPEYIMLTSVFIILCLGCGHYSLVESITEYCNKETIYDFEISMPFLNIDSETGYFCSINIPEHILVRYFRNKLKKIFKYTNKHSRYGMLREILDILITIGNSNRACNLAVQLFNSDDLAVWLESNQQKIVNNLDCFAYLNILKQDNFYISHNLAFKIPQIMNVLALGMEKESIKLIEVLNKNKYIGMDSMGQLIALMCYLSMYETVQKYAHEHRLLEVLRLNENENHLPMRSENRNVLLCFGIILSIIATNTAKKIQLGLKDLIKAWRYWQKRDISKGSRLVIAMLCIKTISEIFKREIIELHGSNKISKRELQNYISKINNKNNRLSKILIYFRNYLEKELGLYKNDCLKPLSAEEYFCIKTLKEGKILEALDPDHNLNLPPSFKIYEKYLKLQKSDVIDKKLFGHESTTSSVRHEKNFFFNEFKSSYKDLEISINVSLFGSLHISRFNSPLISKAFGRQKLQSLIAILAVERGKEINRVDIIHDLWPNSKNENAKRNLYTIWHFLKKALTLPDGSCPYLIKYQHGFKFNESLIKSDYHKIKNLCNEMNVQNPDQEKAASNLLTIQKLYTGKLLPNEQECAKIINYRDNIHNKLINSLVSYTSKLLDDDFPLLALEYANQTLELEKDREDVYIALMLAQIANNQKSLAIKTYKNCRKYLIETIGIDPSPEIVNIYKSLLKHMENF